MKQAIAGVSPAETEETTVMSVWPSITQFGLGRALGRAYAIRFPDIHIFRLGNLIALASIPLALPLYFLRLHPCVYGVSPYGVNYRLTNRRVQVLRNELHFDGSKILRGVILGIVFALLGFFLLPLIATAVIAIGYLVVGAPDQFSTDTDWVALTLGVVGLIGAVGGAAKGFALGTFKFVFNQELKSVQLDRFDTVDIEIQPGQEWFNAGDLVFRDGQVETFRLGDVVRPGAFQSTCMKSRDAYVGVKKAADERQLAAV